MAFADGFWLTLASVLLMTGLLIAYWTRGMMAAKHLWMLLSLLGLVLVFSGLAAARIESLICGTLSLILQGLFVVTMGCALIGLTLLQGSTNRLSGWLFLGLMFALLGVAGTIWAMLV
jgi:hypothetical protein